MADIWGKYAREYAHEKDNGCTCLGFLFAQFYLKPVEGMEVLKSLTNLHFKEKIEWNSQRCPIDYNYAMR